MNGVIRLADIDHELCASVDHVISLLESAIHTPGQERRQLVEAALDEMRDVVAMLRYHGIYARRAEINRLLEEREQALIQAVGEVRDA